MKPSPPCLPIGHSRMHASPSRMLAARWKSGASAPRKAPRIGGLQPLWSCLFLVLCLSAAAQNPTPRTPATYKLIAVKETGSQRFTSEDIAIASGLPVGTVAHEEDFKKAARQLGESGAFG